MIPKNTDAFIPLWPRADIPKLCSVEHQVLCGASRSALQRDWNEK